MRRKLDGGFGPNGDKRLTKVLRQAFAARRSDLGKAGKRSRTAVIEVGCLDLCPKGAVVVVPAGRPERWLVVPAGTPIDDVMAQLGRSPLP